MNEETVTHLAHNLCESFFLAVERFQHLAEFALHHAHSSKNLTVFQNNPSCLVLKTMKELLPGQNKNTYVMLHVLRAINCADLSLLLTVESPGVNSVANYYCLIVVLPAAVIESWRKDIGHNSNLIVREPLLEHEIVNKMQVCISLYENIEIKVKDKAEYNFQDIKRKGNQLFATKQHFAALLRYEYALTKTLFKEDQKNRAILYTNSAACFHELKLYELAIRYANLAIRIDQSYPKAYFRKLNALLENKLFLDIPPLLLAYSECVDPENLTLSNAKYTNYVSNSLGFYNWYDILACEGCESNFSDFQSAKVEVKTMGDVRVYVAKEDIDTCELVLVVKPLFFTNQPNKKFDQILKQIERNLILQPTYKFKLKYLNNGIIKPEQNQSKLTYSNIIRTIISRNLRPYTPLDNFSSDEDLGCGIWDDLSNFQHNCLPNCSYVHIKTAVCVSATKPIPRGTVLTLDYAAYQQFTSRRKFLKEKYDIDCRCNICNEKYWFKQITLQVDLPEDRGNDLSTHLYKELFWYMFKLEVDFPNCENEYKHNLDKIIDLAVKQPHWVDLLRLLEMLKSELMPSSKLNLCATVAELLHRLLKIEKIYCIRMIRELL